MTSGRWRLLAILLAPPAASAQGHGPVYGLSTPTLARGGWSVDAPVMIRATSAGTSAMIRPMISYGLSEDVQVSASYPLPVVAPVGPLRSVRGLMRMPATPDVELTLAWRFHRQGVDVGARFESTAYVGIDYPTDQVRAGVATRPGVIAALVTGYASRTVYLWAGGLYNRYPRPGGGEGDGLGALAMYSVVFGYRPPWFREDYPRPDWRFFIEAVGAWSDEDMVAGVRNPNSGSHSLLVAATVLGLYGAWGLAAGPALPVYQSLNGTQPRERFRWVANVTLWF